MEIRIGEPAYIAGNFVYVWLDGTSRPFYVGETGKSLADRCGLHIRDPSRSGAIVAARIRMHPQQLYVVLCFTIEEELWQRVARENGASMSRASCNRARKAIERKVYEVLEEAFPGMHTGRTCKWKAEAANEFAYGILKLCKERIAGAESGRS
jgi:hypothetical protein